MGYSSGMLDKRVTIRKKVDNIPGAFGKGSAGTIYKDADTVWANVSWARGTKAMREGALDAYDVVMVRMRWNSIVTRECRLLIDDKLYAIESLNSSKTDNTIQITATELVNA